MYLCERQSQREIVHPSVSPHVAPTAGAGPGQEPGLSSRSPTGMQEPKAPDHPPLLSQVHLQEAGSEGGEQPGLILVPIWDAGITSSDLTHYTVVQTHTCVLNDFDQGFSEMVQTVLDGCPLSHKCAFTMLVVCCLCFPFLSVFCFNILYQLFFLSYLLLFPLLLFFCLCFSECKY